MKIVFPEFDNPIIKEALALRDSLNESGTPLYPEFASSDSLIIEPIPAKDLDEACELVQSHVADAMIAGIDYPSRDVILASRDHFDMAQRPESSQLLKSLKVQTASTSVNSADSELYSTFSGLAVMHRPSHPAPDPVDLPVSPSETYLLADMAACKHPTKSQLIDIIWQTYTSAKALLKDEPRIALLSFSTLGSGGRDDFITLAKELIPLFRNQGILIDGEMQLDAAVNPRIGEKKTPGSPVAGHANVLIAPDLNSGNLLYKSFEQFGSFTVAGPILQGFNAPVSDLSRGSTVFDIVLTIEAMAKLINQK